MVLIIERKMDFPRLPTLFENVQPSAADPVASVMPNQWTFSLRNAYANKINPNSLTSYSAAERFLGFRKKNGIQHDGGAEAFSLA